MTPGERYWQNRGIGLGARLEYHAPGALPGTPPQIGIAGTLPDGRPVIRSYVVVRLGDRRVIHYLPFGPHGESADQATAWQPVHTQSQMFGGE